MNSTAIEYIPDKTARAVHGDKHSFVKIVKGPVGGGKSTLCLQDFFQVMLDVPLCTDGVRRAKGLIIRNTYSDLELTTVATWLQWFPEDVFGRFNKKAPFKHCLRFFDGEHFCEFDVHFVSIDRPDDLKKVLSLELTVFYVNECREIPFSVITGLLTRLTGRYPSKPMLGLPLDYQGKMYYQCLIADTNAPSCRHWLREIETSPPDGWTIYNQPPWMIPATEDQQPDLVNGLGAWVINPHRENLRGSSAAETIKMAKSLDDETFKVYVLSEYGSNFDGKPVHPEYNSHLHFSRDVIEPVPGCALYLGWDFGATPAVVVWQLVGGKIILLDNFQAEWSDIKTFIDSAFLPVWNTKYHEWASSNNYISTGDPAGSSIVSHEIRTLNESGIKTFAAFSNDPATRRAALTQWLNRNHNGKPALQISNHCDFIHESYAGGYRYKRLNLVSDGAVRYHSIPDKNEYSHSAEAGEYGLMPLYNGANQKKKLTLNPVSRTGDTIKYAWG